MSQIDQIKVIMSKLQNYAKIPNGIITPNEIEKAFRNYGLNSNMINKPLNHKDRRDIIDMLYSKMDERKCTSTLGFGFQEGWNFFETNYNKSEQTPNFQWKVYIPIKSEHYGFLVKNIISFLCDNGIVSLSKVSGTMRSDSLIINLVDPDDVTRLNEYIDKIPSLKSCIGLHQPFIPDFNGIGVLHGFDTETSYTERLSRYLAHYINVCKQQNRLDLITAEDFLKNMKNSLNKGMVQKPNEIQQIIEHMDVIMYNKDYVQHEFENKPHHKL